MPETREPEDNPYAGMERTLREHFDGYVVIGLQCGSNEEPAVTIVGGLTQARLERVCALMRAKLAQMESRIL